MQWQSRNGEYQTRVRKKKFLYSSDSCTHYIHKYKFANIANTPIYKTAWIKKKNNKKTIIMFIKEKSLLIIT